MATPRHEAAVAFFDQIGRRGPVFWESGSGPDSPLLEHTRNRRASYRGRRKRRRRAWIEQAIRGDGGETEEDRRDVGEVD